MSISLTIFTPTYNRAGLLPRLFESIKSQKCKDFEWIVIDDGSTDATKTIIENYKKEVDFPIHYFYQTNMGKHTAINAALKLASGKMFLTVDSDDLLLENAVSYIISKKDLLFQNPNVAALAFEKAAYKENFRIDYDSDQEIQLINERDYLFKTEIYRKYKYPVFKGEKFCKESVVYKQIWKKYKYLEMDYPCSMAEYQPSGLSSNHRKLIEQNPKGQLFYLSIRVKFENDFKDKYKFFKEFWRFGLRNRKKVGIWFLLKNNSLLSLIFRN